MRFFLFWRLFKSNHIKPRHKKYIFLAMSVMCLECLDIIVYISNANSITEIYLPAHIEHFIGLVILLFILWISNLLGRTIYNKALHQFPQVFLSRLGLLISAFSIAISLGVLSWIVIYLCATHFYRALFLMLILTIL